MTVSILGCGWYGFELAKLLVKKGVTVKGSTTSAEKLPLLAGAGIDAYLINLSAGKKINPAFFDCDVLWIAIPPKARTGNGDEYLANIKQLIKQINTHAIKQVILISSTSVYGDCNMHVTELTTPNPDTTSGKVMLAAEELLTSQPGFTTTIIRFAGLIGPGRLPGRFFAGKTNVPNGAAPVNLIQLTDCLGVSETLLDKKAFGFVYNACSPQHPKRADFYTQAAISLGLEAPGFIEEKKSWKIVDSINVENILGYNYKEDLI